MLTALAMVLSVFVMNTSVAYASTRADAEQAMIDVKPIMAPIIFIGILGGILILVFTLIPSVMNEERRKDFMSALPILVVLDLLLIFGPAIALAVAY